MPKTKKTKKKPKWGWQIEPLWPGTKYRLVETHTCRFEIKPSSMSARAYEIYERDYPLKVEIEDLRNKYAGSYVFRIRKGFKFDGASVPQILHSFAAPMHGAHINASLMHDWLYKEKFLERHTDSSKKFLAPVDCTKELADLIFLVQMEIDGVDQDKAEMMYDSVRNHGWRAWRD